ncbi:MAG: Acg family FMN-binding oxidoreductase [Jatrophihabitans sp.]|uniref:Acg family FMN-binding oxidoreductase n=1 Tax=Jatrophihabitans sp. TaxID=1932789 RepID=UPI003F81A09C
MSTGTDVDLDRALHRAAHHAALAPSVHNTQPWQFVLRADRIELVADRTRHLAALDPHGRQLAVSLGCALFNLRAALAADGVGTRVERLDGPDDVVARVTWPAGTPVETDIARFDHWISTRQTNRRRFEDTPVPEDVVDALAAGVEAEGSILFPITREEDRVTVARLSQRADSVQLLDPAYRSELRRWTTSDPTRRDGVQAMAVPHVDGSAQDEIPIRDFDSSGAGWLPSRTESSRHQCLLLLGTRSDTPLGWLRAGEALERMWLEATSRGLAMGPLTQVVEVAPARAQLAQELRLDWSPVVLVRVGRAPVSPMSLRRPWSDVVVEAR